MMIKHLHKITNEKYGLNKSIWYSQDPDSIKYYEHIGMKEIGRHWQLSLIPTKEQKEFFTLQIEMAMSHNLPVVIHTRDSTGDAISIVESFSGKNLKALSLVYQEANLHP